MFFLLVIIPSCWSGLLTLTPHSLIDPSQDQTLRMPLTLYSEPGCSGSSKQITDSEVNLAKAQETGSANRNGHHATFLRSWFQAPGCFPATYLKNPGSRLKFAFQPPFWKSWLNYSTFFSHSATSNPGPGLGLFHQKSWWILLYLVWLPPITLCHIGTLFEHNAKQNVPQLISCIWNHSYPQLGNENKTFDMFPAVMFREVVNKLSFYS